MRYFKDHLKILASIYRKSHYPESHYQHSISNGQALQKFHFSVTNFFWKNRTSILDAPQYFSFVQLFSINIIVIQLLISLQFPTHPYKGCPMVFQTNRCLNFLKHPSISVSEKIATQNIFGNFLSTLRSFLKKSCSEQLFCREPVFTCFWKKEFPSTCYLRNFLEFQQDRKLKAVSSFQA